MNHLTEDQMTLLYYGEAAGEERAHAASCEECRTNFADFSQLLDAVRNVPAADPGPAFERRVWQAIGPRVSQTLSARKPLWSRLWLLGPALAAGLAVVFFAGMYTQHRVDRSHAEAFSPNSRERVLLITMGDHLDRSQIVLTELTHAPESGVVDISNEQQLAGSLIGENRLLRQTALHSGDATDAALLDQLERVLLDIAHSPAEVSPGELKDLQNRIEAQGLLFKVRIVSAADRKKGMKL